MTGLGQPGRARPKTRPGDYERALALIVEVGGDKQTRAYLAELVDATAAHDQARDDAQATAAAATKRDQMAREAEADATRARQALADETAAARAELGQREVAVADREHVADTREVEQAARDKELARREDLLREAGVANF